MVQASLIEAILANLMRLRYKARGVNPVLVTAYRPYEHLLPKLCAAGMNGWASRLQIVERLARCERDKISVSTYGKLSRVV